MKLSSKNSINHSIILKAGKITLDFEQPKVMGILNLTRDSFYDGGNWLNEKDYLNKVDQMLKEGASIIDIGAVSTRPGAQVLSENEELERLIPALQNISTRFPDTVLSVDTFRNEVARMAMDSGADMINDISGGTMDNEMLPLIAKLNAPYIMMHMQGNPATMQINPTYNDVVEEIFSFFQQQINQLTDLGFQNSIIIDPGFGFGKTVEHNYDILSRLSQFSELHLPILAGLSRKSMINRVLKTKPENALNGTTILNTLALLNGASILRVHDVKEAMQAIKLVEYYKSF